ncbi:MAG: hypothetical protein ACYSW3_09030 [Planctomycetota bacterium]|jgi:hypothetical protein
MGRSAKEHCRPAQAVDGGGQVNQSKVDYGDDGEEPWLNSIVKAGAKFYAAKEIAGELDLGDGDE